MELKKSETLFSYTNSSLTITSPEIVQHFGTRWYDKPARVPAERRKGYVCNNRVYLYQEKHHIGADV